MIANHKVMAYRNGFRIFAQLLLLFAVVLYFPGHGVSATWIQFHTETWAVDSQRLNKRLDFRNVYFYDGDNLKRGKNGDIVVWMKELSYNDKYYVRKGIPAEEIIYKNIRILCQKNRYEILLGDESATDFSDNMSEEIKQGSLYEKLQTYVCVK